VAICRTRHRRRCGEPHSGKFAGATRDDSSRKTRLGGCRIAGCCNFSLDISGVDLPSLFVIQGTDQGKRIDVTSEAVRVGRDSDNAVRLHDTEVSRHHAEVRFDAEENRYLIVDLDSSNGTFVNGVAVQQRELRNGDRILVGCTLMIYTGQDELAGSDVLEDVDIVTAHMDSNIVRTLPDTLDTLPSADSQWLARARSNLQVMYRTALAVSHTMDIDQLVRRVMELIFEWVEADRGCIMLVDREQDQLVPKVRMNRPGTNPHERMTISRTILDYVMQHQEGVLTSDAKADQRFDAAASIVKMGTREAICVPMQGRYGIVGIIYVDTFTSPGKLLEQGIINKFNEEHLKLMIAIGHQAALAVEDTSYYSAMVQAERLAAIGQTIAGLSHHVKNILQGIRGGSYLIEEGLNSDEQEVVRKGWRIVERNQEKISRLVLDMLTFSKDREPDLVPGDLNQAVRDVVELMQTRADEAHTQLNFQAHEDMPLVSFDPEGISHALLNIVTNAIDACENVDGAEVTIQIDHSEPRHQAIVRVTDTGLGIAEDDLPRIFGLFVSRKGARGTGLGLSVSRKIVREHGGEIHAASELGKGSTFTLELPCGGLQDDSEETPSTTVVDGETA
jgi:two-component system NtrC family sensor kinase